MAELARIRHLIYEGRWSTARAEASGDAVGLAYIRAHAARVGVLPEAKERYDPECNDGSGYGDCDCFGDGVGCGEDFSRGRDVSGCGNGRYDNSGDGYGDDHDLSYGRGDGYGFAYDRDLDWYLHYESCDYTPYEEYEHYYI